ncbi:MAG: aldose 1-epimerase [Acidimicrobiales bacterium]
MPNMHLATESVSLIVDPEHGGRLASLEIAGSQVLVVEPTLGTLQWGSYPMVPWAGRIRDGSFAHGGITHQMPCNLPPHAAHGTGFTSQWTVVDEATIALDLGSPWPFPGRVTQHFALSDDELVITMSLSAAVDMPAMLGWHPWFARYMPVGDMPVGDMPIEDKRVEDERVEAELSFGSAMMYELDESAIPTGDLVTPPPGPWDNCFTSLQRQPSIRWPGVLELDLQSSCDHWVIYTEPEHALCVEPQSGPPDAFNRNPMVIEAGQDYQAWFRLAWR